MWKSILLFICLALLGAAAAWLADRPGSITLHWGSWRIDTSPALAVLTGLVLAVISALVYRIWRFFIAGPAALARSRRDARRQKGYQALSRGLVAVAAGDAGEARKLAKRTAALLDDPPLTLLLSAQAAQLDGDEAGARQHFESMSENSDTEFLGLRGLLVQARREGDDLRALELSRRAYALRPDTRWVVAERFALESGQGEWSNARDVARRARKRGLLPTDDGDRYLAICDLGAALAAEASGNAGEALKLARQALSSAPGLTPAICAVARLWTAAGSGRKAQRLLEKNWSVASHPDLAEAYLDAAGVSEPDARLAALRKLTASAAEHEESKLVLARAALAADALEEAEALLSDLTGGTADRSALRLMADLAEARGADDQARHWLRLAAMAPEEAAWTCEGCHHRASEWAPHCAECGAFDSLHWQRPNSEAAAADIPLAIPQAPAADTSAEDAPEEEEADSAGGDAAADAGEAPAIEILPPQTGSLAQAEAAAGDDSDAGDRARFIDENGTVRDPDDSRTQS
jgi:HemY protein